MLRNAWRRVINTLFGKSRKQTDRLRTKKRLSLRLGVMQLEDRITPTTTPVFLNDNWNFIADNDASTSLTVGDTVDTTEGGGVTATYGIDGFGTVTTGAFTGTVAGAATLQDAIDGVDAGGIVNVLPGTYDITGSASPFSGVDIAKALTLQATDFVDGTPDNTTTILRGVDTGTTLFIDIRINSADVTIQGFTLDFNDTTNDRQIGGIEANANANLQNIHILNNVIELTDSDNNTFGDASYGFRTGGTGDIDGLQINNNNFLANGPTGGLAVYINPVTTQPATGIQINSNTVSGQVIRGLTADGISNVTIDGNTLDTTLSASNDSALIRIMPFDNSTQSNFTISNNLIGTSGAGMGGVRGISIGNASGTVTDATLTNNVVNNTSLRALTATNVTTLNLTNFSSTGNASGGSITNSSQINLTTTNSADTINVSGNSFSTGTLQTITYSNAVASFFDVFALDGNDTINVSPATTAENVDIDVHGGNPVLPTSPGDTLNFNTPGGQSSTLIAGVAGAGTIQTTGGFKDVDFDSIESYAPTGDVVINAGAGSNNIVVQQDATGNIVVTIDGVTVLNSPLAGLTSLTVNGEDGDDTLNVDYSAAGGFFDLDLVFNGGTGAADSDALAVTGGTFTTATHTFTAAGPEHSGNILYDTGAVSATISYTGLEPIDMTGSTITDLVFNLPGTNDQAFLEDDAGAVANVSQIRSNNGVPTFDTTTFTTPTGSLTINMGGDSGTLTVATLDAQYNASLIIDGQAGAADVVTITGALSLGSTTSAGLLNITAETINLNNATINTDQGTAVAGGDVTFTGAVVLGANVSIDSDRAAGTDGNVSFVGAASTVNADAAANNRTLSINAGGGDVSFGGDVGTGQPLQSLTVNSAVNISLNGSVVTTGPVQLVGSNQVTVNSINVGASTVTISANQDAAGSNDFTQASGAITTTNQTANAVSITVNTAGGGTGNANLLAINAGTTTGVVTVATNGGAILDADAAATTNITSFMTVLSGQFIGAVANPLDVAVNSLTTNTAAANGNQNIVESNGLTELNLNAGATGDINLTLTAGAVQSADAATDIIGDVVTVSAPAGFGSTSATPGNAIQTTVNVLSVTTSAGSQFILESDAVTLNTFVASNLTLTAGGAITDGLASSIAVTGLATFNAGANAITLGDDAGDTTNFGSVNVTGGAVSISEDSDTNLAGANAASLTLNTTGALMVSGKATVTGAVMFDAVNNITVNAAIDPTTVLMESDDDIIINAAVTATDRITLRAGQDGSGNIIINAGGSLTVTGASGDIVLRAGTASGNIQLAGAVSAVDTADFTSQGGVDQTGSTISAANLLLRGAGAFTIDEVGNDITTLSANIVDPSASLEYRDSTGFSVGSVTPVEAGAAVNGVSVAGDITLCTDTGDLSLTQVVNAGTDIVRLHADTGNVTQTASGIITAGALGVRVGGNVGLDVASNQLAAGGVFAAAAGGSVTYRNANSFTVGTVTALGCFTPGVTGITAGGDITLCVDNGDLNVTTAINAGANTIRLHADAGNVTQTAAGILTANALGVLASGNIDLDAAVNAVNTFAAQAQNINAFVEFRNGGSFATGQVTASGCFDTTVTGVTTNGGRITLVADAGTITVGTTGVANSGISTGAAGNIVRLQATTGAVTQVAEGAIVSDLLGVRATGAVTLTAAPNDNASLTINTTGLVEYRDVGDVTISAVGASGGFTMLTAGVVSGNNDINLQIGGNLLLNDAVAGVASIDAGTADARIVAVGTVNQVNPGDNIIADELGIRAGGAVTLAAGDNDVNTLAVTTTGLVEFRDTDNLIVGQVLTGGNAGFTTTTGVVSGNNNINLQTGTSLAINQPLNAGTTGDIRLVAGTTVSQVAAGTITGDLLGIRAGGAVTLTAAINDVNTLAASTTGTIEFRDSDDLSIGTVLAGGNAGFTTDTNGLVSNSNDINLNVGTSLILTRVIDAGAADIRLVVGTTASQTDPSAVITADELGITAGGAVTLALASNDVNTLAVSTTGTIEFRDNDDLTIGAVAAGGNAGFAGATGLVSNGGDINLSAGTTLTINEALNAGTGDVRVVVSGVSITQAAAGVITADELGILAGGTVALGVAVNDVNTLAITADGAVEFRDGDDLTIGTVAAGGGAGFTGATGVVTTNDDITLCADTGDLSLTQAVNAGAGTVRLHADTGNVTQTATGIITAGALGVRVGGNVGLDVASNQLAVGGVFAAAAGGSVAFRNANSFTFGTVTALGCFTPGVTGVTAGGDITLCVDNGDLNITAPLNAGANTIRLHADNGNVTQTAAGVLTANALGVLASGNIDLDTAVNAVNTFAAQAQNINAFVEFRNGVGFATGQVTASGCFDTTVTGVTTNGGRVTLVADTGTITVGTTGVANSGISTGAAGNIVRLQATAGAVTQVAEGAIVSDLLGVRATGAVTLTAAPNDNASLTINTTGLVEYRDVGDVTISAVGASGGFTMLTAGVVSGNNNINLQIGGNLLLNDAVAGVASIDAGTADARIVATGTVNQINAGDNIIANELGIRAGGDVTLCAGDNDVDSLAVFTTGLIEFRDTDDLTIDTVGVPAPNNIGFTATNGLTSNGNDINLGVATFLTINQPINAGAGDIRLRVGTTVNQIATGTITGDELGIQAAGAVTLTAAPNDVNTLAINTTGLIEFSDEDDLIIGTVAAGGNCGFTGAVGLTSAGNDINLRTANTATGALQINQTINAGAANIVRIRSVTVSTPAVNQSAAGSIIASMLGVQAAGAVMLAAGANDVTTVAISAAGVTEFSDENALIINTVAAGVNNVGFTGAVGITSGGNNINLRAANTATGTLTINQAVAAGAGDLRIRHNVATATAITQNAPGVITGNRLGIQAVGAVDLNNVATNDFNVFAVATTGQIDYRDATSLTTDAVAASGGAGFTGVTNSSTGGSNFNLTIGASLSVGNSGTLAGSINAGGGVINASFAQVTRADLFVNVQVTASLASFLGGNEVDAAGTVGNTFSIMPSATAPITIDGANPTFRPGDAFNLQTAGVIVTSFVFGPSGPNDSRNGTITFSNRQTLTFFRIETFNQLNLQVFSFVTNANTFAVQVQQNFAGVNAATGLNNAVAVRELTFLLSPNLVNPTTPFSSPRVALGDVNGDGFADIIFAQGPGSGDQFGPLVTVIDGQRFLQAVNSATAITEDAVLTRFFAYAPTFRGGVFVAAGDLDNDGKAEIVTGADAGGGPHVRVFTNVAAPDPRNVNLQQFNGPLGSFFAFFPSFTGGVRVAVGDVNGDGRKDVIVAAGQGGGPHVRALDAMTGAELKSFFAYSPLFAGGVFVSAGDFNADGFDDIVTGAGAPGAPHIRLFDGKTQGELLSFFANMPQPVLSGPFAAPSSFAMGVSSIAMGSRNSQGTLDILVGTGAGIRAQALRFSLAGPPSTAFPPSVAALDTLFLGFGQQGVNVGALPF